MTVRDEKGTLRRARLSDVVLPASIVFEDMLEVKVLSPELKEQVKNLKDQSQVDVQDTHNPFETLFAFMKEYRTGVLSMERSTER